MTEHRTPPGPSSRPKVRSPRAIRTLVMCALAGAPAAACGPSQTTDPVEPQPSADAGVVPDDPGPQPAYGVPVEPDPAVTEYGVPAPEPYQPVVSEYAVVEPPIEAVGAYGAPMQ
jgi:hypothetical protein